MKNISGLDWLIGIIITIIIICIYFFIWPGLYRVNAYKIEGYWSDPLNQIHKIISINKRNFKIISANNGITYGNTFSIRGIYLNGENTSLPGLKVTPIMKGTITNNNRTIQWANGYTWIKQSA